VIEDKRVFARVSKVDEFGMIAPCYRYSAGVGKAELRAKVMKWSDHCDTNADIDADNCPGLWQNPKLIIFTNGGCVARNPVSPMPRAAATPRKAVVKGNVDAKSVMDTILKANARHAKDTLHRRRSSNTHPRFELQEKGSSSEGSELGQGAKESKMIVLIARIMSLTTLPSNAVGIERGRRCSSHSSTSMLLSVVTVGAVLRMTRRGAMRLTK
jgi:hypothetical protein